VLLPVQTRDSNSLYDAKARHAGTGTIGARVTPVQFVGKTWLNSFGPFCHSRPQLTTVAS
jgi:hypothetical protein